MCGPCPEAGTPGRVACLLSLPRLPASLSLTSETVHSLGLKSASQLTQAVDVAHTGPGFLLLVKGAQVSWHTAVLPQLSGVVRVLW